MECGMAFEEPKDRPMMVGFFCLLVVGKDRKWNKLFLNICYVQVSYWDFEVKEEKQNRAPALRELPVSECKLTHPRCLITLELTPQKCHLSL